MDLAVRTLREGGGAEGGLPPMLVMADSLQAVASGAVFRQLLLELASAIAQRRAQAAALTVVALQRPAAEYLHLCSALLTGPHQQQQQLAVLDCFQDPWGWGGGSNGNSSGSSSGCTAGVPAQPGATLLAGVLQSEAGLEQLLEVLGSSCGGSTPHCIVIDSLSVLLDRFGERSVARFLQALQHSGRLACLLGGLHADLHSAQAMACLEYLAAGTIQLQPASSGSDGGGSSVQGRLAVRLKRRSGRVRTEAQLYRVVGPAQIELQDLLISSMPTAQPLKNEASSRSAATAAAPQPAAPASEGGAATAQLGQMVAGGMKLSLSLEEEEARQRVQLPFEHQGRGAAYQTGDYRDYLPPQAGGRAGGEGAASTAGLGRILYVRDSASEHDSDEDPDDDLDI